MLNTVGPQMVGATDLKSVSGQGFGQRTLAKDFKSSNSESSFGKTLEKASQGPPKENKSKEEVSEFSQGNTKAHDDPENLRNADSSEMKTKDRSESPPKLEARSEDNRAEQKVAKPDGISKRKTASRQQAIKEFMDSFESEFQIPPTRLVEAMAQLDDSQLKESPEKTADAVIEQLGLDETQANKARAMYASLL
ncbi:MAG TPA: hypothetical protein VN132_15470, partial [Bdellovibrio sp.]|nr:hypothetical protein [Bdellovibrio sp.]